ncbi:hypothetical protein KEM52_006180 [Ascosphaera acerosa]|nr:hypothetical protein KEM52_006180 [Ascosphaera acerosa]
MASLTTPVAIEPQPLPWRATPLIESGILSRQAGCRVFLKLEHLQPSGSFKSRAIGNLVLSHVRNPSNAGKRLHFFIPSGGNAGLAATVAARSYGFPCTVAIPTTITPLMANQLRAAGANVVVHGDTIDQAAQYMRAVLMRDAAARWGPGTVAVELHPFDRQAIWDGVSSLVDELAEQLPPSDRQQQPLPDCCGCGDCDCDCDCDDHGTATSCSRPASGSDCRAIPCDAIVCSVGGGGLMNGIVQGLQKHAKTAATSSPARPSRRRPSRPHRLLHARPVVNQDVHILAAETHGCESLYESVVHGAGEPVTLPRITSIASSLGVTRVADKTLQNALHPPPGVQVHPVVLSDAEAAMGALRLVDAERILVETACGVAVEAAIGPVAARKGKGKGSARSRTPRSVASDASLESESDEMLPSPPSSAASAASSGDEADEGEAGRPDERWTNRLAQIIPGFNSQSRVVIIVCGGSNVSIDMAAEWRTKLAGGWAREAGDDLKAAA